jgi:hypothetical protein
MRLASAVVVSLAALLAGCLTGCRCDSTTKVTPGYVPNTIPPAPTSGVIPRLRGALTFDGVLKEPDWQTGSLLIQLRREDGDLARPYAEVRFLHDEANLYFAAYAADTNVTSEDAFSLDIGPLHEQFFASGRIAPESPDIKLAVDVDGTIDKPEAKDEEWRFEAAIPLAKTGLAPGAQVDTHVERCDTLKDGKKYCGDWTGKLSLQ